MEMRWNKIQKKIRRIFGVWWDLRICSCFLCSWAYIGGRPPDEMNVTICKKIYAFFDENQRIIFVKGRDSRELDFILDFRSATNSLRNTTKERTVEYKFTGLLIQILNSRIVPKQVSWLWNDAILEKRDLKVFVYNSPRNIAAHHVI